MRTQPIIRSASLSVTVGGAMNFNDDDLRNPYNTPMLLDEIHISYQPVNPTTAQVLGLVRSKFWMGPYQMTNDFVPVNLFSKRYNIHDVGATSAGDDFIWKFPKPLYVPQGMNVSGAMQFVSPTQLAAGCTSVNAQITYYGRQLIDAPKPAKINVPWVAGWVGTPWRPSDGSNVDQSYENDLVNPFDVPLKVQRICGGVMIGENAVPKLWYDAFYSTETVVNQYISIQMIDHLNQMVILDQTPMPNLFGLGPQAVDVNADLEPHGYYIAIVNEDDTPGGSGYYMPMVSIVGHREVTL